MAEVSVGLEYWAVVAIWVAMATCSNFASAACKALTHSVYDATAKLSCHQPKGVSMDTPTKAVVAVGWAAVAVGWAAVAGRRTEATLCLFPVVCSKYFPPLHSCCNLGALVSATSHLNLCSVIIQHTCCRALQPHNQPNQHPHEVADSSFSG